MMFGNTQLGIIMLYVNGVNLAIKSNQIAEQIKQQNATICCLEETHLRKSDTHRFKVKGWSRIYYVSSKVKTSGVAIVISEKAKTKK